VLLEKHAPFYFDNIRRFRRHEYFLRSNDSVRSGHTGHDPGRLACRGHGARLAQHVLAPIERTAETAGVSYSGSSVSSGSPADAIVATAEQQGCDLICMASEDHRDLLGVHLGSETTRVLTHARVPVLICR
jgi:nucleotide-binding universal stress UspA family protein